MAVTLVERDGRPRTARRVDPYRREGVAFRNGGVVLAGTLRLPVGSGRRPAVILLHGSNRQTRAGQDGLLGSWPTTSPGEG
ncbi:MAG: hypothetical protein ACREOF_05845 [Gemmatimonadales bacterium]